MYQRFLKQDYTDKTARAFEAFGYAVLDQKQRDPKKVIQSQKKLFDQLSPRDQYLIQHEGQAYIELLYQGEGMFTYRRQPNNLVDVFLRLYPLTRKNFYLVWQKTIKTFSITMVLWLFHGKSSLNVLYFGKSLFKNIQKLFY